MAVLRRRRPVAAAADRHRAARLLLGEDVVELGPGTSPRRRAGGRWAARCRPARDPRGQRLRRRRTRPPSPPRERRSRPGSSSTDRSGPCAENSTARRGRHPPARSSLPPAAATAKSWLVPMLRCANSCRPAHAGASRSRSSRSAANHGRAGSGSVTAGGIVMSPRKRTPASGSTSPRKRVDGGGHDPRLRVLAGHVHLQQAVHDLVRSAAAVELLAGRQRVDRVDQPDAAHQVAHLAALHVADEVPREQVAEALLLREQRVGAVLAHQRRRPPRPAPAGRLRRRTWSRPGSRPAARPARGSGPGWPRTAAGSSTSSPTTPCRPVTPLSRRCEKYRSGLQIVHSSATATASHPGGLERPPGAQPQIGAAVADDVVAEPRAQPLGHVRRRPRSSTAPRRGRPRPPARRPPPRPRPRRPPPRARASRRAERQTAAVGACDRDRDAVGGEQQERLLRQRGGEPVRARERLAARLEEPPAGGLLRDLADVAAVHLPGHRRPAGLAASPPRPPGAGSRPRWQARRPSAHPG